MNEYADVGRILRGARIASGESQSRVAEDLGVSVRTLQSWESGARCPSLAQAARMRIFLGRYGSAFWGLIELGDKYRDGEF